MNTIPASSVGNSRIATGTIAMAGMGRASSVSGPKTFGERPRAAEQDAGDDARDRGEREPGEDADQRLAEVQPVVLGAEPMTERRDDLGDGRQGVEPQPEPNVVGGQHLPERDGGGHRGDADQPATASCGVAAP